MKKFIVIERVDGELTTNTYYATKVTEIKKNPNFIAIESSERVKHPSPEVLQRVIINNFTNPRVVSLEFFYEQCEKLQEALDEKNGVDGNE